MKMNLIMLCEFHVNLVKSAYMNFNRT